MPHVEALFTSEQQANLTLDRLMEHGFFPSQMRIVAEGPHDAIHYRLVVNAADAVDTASAVITQAGATPQTVNSPATGSARGPYKSKHDYPVIDSATAVASSARQDTAGAVDIRRQERGRRVARGEGPVPEYLRTTLTSKLWGKLASGE